MPNFAKLTVARDVATVTYNGETLRVGYNPEAINQAWLNQITTFGEQAKANTITDEEARDGLVDLAFVVLLDWDATEGEGKDAVAVPLTRAALRQTALAFQTALLTAIIGHTHAKNATGAASPKRSRTTSSRKAR